MMHRSPRLNLTVTLRRDVRFLACYVEWLGLRGGFDQIVSVPGLGLYNGVLNRGFGQEYTSSLLAEAICVT